MEKEEANSATMKQTNETPAAKLHMFQRLDRSQQTREEPEHMVMVTGRRAQQIRKGVVLKTQSRRRKRKNLRTVGKRRVF